MGSQMTEFTPVLSLIGGAIIGLATVALMAFHGRIAGINGIAAGLLARPGTGDWAWRAAFIAGMIASPMAKYMNRMIVKTSTVR